MRRTLALVMLVLFSLSWLAACGAPQKEAVTLRVGLLPILDALPFYVAQEEGYFAAEGVEVEFVPVASAAERDQLLMAGQVDVVIDDLVSLLLLDREGVQVVAVRTAMRPTEAFAQFRILASAQSGIEGVDGLRGVSIGISEGTIIEYLTEQLLQRAGLEPEEIETVAVPRIPDRMALLESGELEAAMLPEPLASLAMAKGARVVLDDRAFPDLSCSLVSVRAEVLEAHPQAVRAMLSALEQSVAAINADKGRWDALLAEKHLLPPSLAGSFALPDYPTASVPSADCFEAVRQWVEAKGLLSSPPAYEAVVRGDLLP